MNILLNEIWNQKLSYEIKKQYFLDLIDYINQEQKTKIIFPQNIDIFNAFNITPFEDIKVIILGQDPYHGENQAHGLAFSVQGNVSIPPSLKNIFKEYTSDLSFNYPKNGNLTKWANEGVFLLNTVLSVRKSEANSHKGKGWEKFTDSVIKIISEQKEHIVFILWGKPAQLKSKLIDENKHLILKAPHPSPLSSYRGFFGSKPFSKVNEYLKDYNIEQIDWRLK